MSLSYKKRLEIAFLACHPKGPHMKNIQIAVYTRVHRTTVSRWVNCYIRTKDVLETVKLAKKPVTTPKQDQLIVSTLDKNRNLSISKVNTIMKAKGVSCSNQTIRNRLAKAGFFHGPTIKKPLLNADQRYRRIQWAQRMMQYDWNRAIFTDESSFWAYTAVHRIWRKKGEKSVVRTMKYPTKVHVWGCISNHGFGCIYVFSKTLESKRMVHIYKHKLLPSARNHYSSTNDWDLFEDNDPKHTSGLCTQWKAANQINRLDWPVNSPDLNPIENVWGLMKSQLSGKVFRTTEVLAARIRKLWDGLSLEYAQSLVGSMPRRLQAAIENEGDFTLY